MLWKPLEGEWLDEILDWRRGFLIEVVDGDVLVWTYPPRMESNCLLPVEMRTTFLRWWWSSIAVTKPEAEGCKDKQKR
jgi:hypothetical protein